MKDKVFLNLADNPELAEYFSRKAPGDSCTLEITATLDDTANDTATLSVQGVEYEEGEGEVEVDDEDDEMGAGAMMDSDKGKETPPAVAIVLGMGGGKKRGKK